MATKLHGAARKIRRGELVAFPTETVYGLGANALDAAACAAIYREKGRPSDNPLIVHINDESMLQLLTPKVSKQARMLMKRFWPGPLTILFPKIDAVPSIVTAGLPSVAVRMPDHPIALALIKEAGVPIAAPSANKSGRPSPTSAAHVREDFPKLTILDGGEAQHGLESTVVLLSPKPTILRLGAISKEELQEVLPDIRIGVKGKVQSPGMKYRHYAPKQPLRIFRTAAKLQAYAKKKKGCTVLCMTHKKNYFKGLRVVDLGATLNDVAHHLFSALRSDGKELLFLAVPKKGIGRAIMDRVERAAS